MNPAVCQFQTRSSKKCTPRGETRRCRDGPKTTCQNRNRGRCHNKKRKQIGKTVNAPAKRAFCKPDHLLNSTSKAVAGAQRCAGRGELRKRKGDGRKKLFCAVLVVPKLCIKCNYIFLLGLLGAATPSAKAANESHIPWSLGEGCRFFKCSEQGFGFEIRMPRAPKFREMGHFSDACPYTPALRADDEAESSSSDEEKKARGECDMCSRPPAFIQHPHHPQPPPIAMDLPSPSSCSLFLLPLPHCRHQCCFSHIVHTAASCSFSQQSLSNLNSGSLAAHLRGTPLQCRG